MELNYTYKLDIVQAQKKAKEMTDSLAKLNSEALKAANNPASTANYKAYQLPMQDALRRSRLELQELKKTQQEYKNQQAESGAATAELTRKIAENRLEQQQLIAATRAARTANVAVSGSYKEAQQQLTALGNRIRGVEGGFNNLGKAQQARIKEYNELNNKLKAFDAQMGNNQRNVGNYKSALSGVKGELIGMIGQYASLAAVIGVVGKTFNQSLKSDSVRTSLEFTFGSVDLADAKLKQLLETANRLGVDYNALTSSYKSFAGAVIASNFDFQTGEKIFNAVAGASARLKLSSEDTEGALRALQQMISKGNVQAEELRGQLGERIPGAFSIAARAMNVTEAELNKMLQKGDVLAADLLPKLATELEKTFDTNSTERVEGLAAAWGRLTNVFSGTVAESGRITKFFTALIDGVGEASKAIANMVNSSSWDEFVARLFVNDNGKTGDNIRSITDAVEKSQKVINKSYNVDANSGAKTILTTYEEIKIAYEKASKALTAYKKGVADGTLVEKGANTIKSLSATVDVLNSQMNRLKNNLPANSVKTPVKSQKQINEEEAAAIKAQRIREQNDKTAIRNAESFSEKLTEIHTTSFRKTLSNDEAEIQAVKDKYKKLKEEADKYYNDPKNNRVVKINGKNVSKSEVYGMIKSDAANEEAAILARRAKEARDKEKADFDKSEKERYATALEAAKTYEQKVLEINKEYADKAKTIREIAAKEGLNPDAQIAVLNEKWQSELEGEKQTAFQKTEIYRKLNNETLELTRSRIIEEIKALQALVDSGVLTGKLKTKIEAQLSSLKGVLSIGVDETNLKNLEERIALIVAALSNPNALSKEQIVAYNKELAETQQRIDNIKKSDFLKGLEENFAYLKKGAGTKEFFEGLSSDLGQISGSFGELSNALGGVNTEAGYTLDTIGQLVGVASDAAGAAASFASGDIIGGVTKTIKAISGIFSIGKKVKEMNAAARKEVEDFYANAIAGEKAYQDLLKQRALDNVRQNKSALQGIRDEIALRKKYATDAAKEAEEIMAKIQSQSYVSDVKYTHGTWFRKAKTENIMSSLAGKNFADLSQLLAQGKLEGEVKALVERLVELEKQGYDASKALENLFDEENRGITGTTADAIANGIINGFKSGKKSSKEFTDDFKGLMEDSLLSSFRNDYLDAAIDGFYKDFAKAASDGLTDGEILILENQYAKIIDGNSSFLDAMSKIRGEALKVNDPDLEAFGTTYFPNSMSIDTNCPLFTN